MNSQNIGTIDYAHPEQYQYQKLSGFVELKVTRITEEGFEGLCQGERLLLTGKKDLVKPGDICEISGVLIAPYTIKVDEIILYQQWKRNLIIGVSLLTLVFITIFTIMKIRIFQ